MPVPGLRGRLPRRAPEDRFPLRWAHEYLTAPLSAPTYPVNVTEGITDLGMQGNDVWGDCVEAGEVHLEMTTSVAASNPFTPAPDLAVSRAKQYAGFTSPPGPGTDMPGYLHSLYLAGIIKGWCPVDHTDQATCVALMAAGFGLLIGVNLFDGNETQFNQGQPFDVIPGQIPDPEDGHCVLWAEVQSPTGPHEVGTWAVWWQTTQAWIEACLVKNPDGEAYLVITTEEQLAQFEPALVTELDAVGGGDDPSTVPTPEPGPDPSPNPGPTFIERLEQDIRNLAKECPAAVEEVGDLFKRLYEEITGVIKKLWNRIPLAYRNAIAHAAVLYVVTFASSVWALGLNHLTATAIIAAAVAAARVVLAKVMPGFPEAKKPKGATNGSH